MTRTLLEQKRLDLAEIRQDMKGISPRTSTYQKLQVKAREMAQDIAKLQATDGGKCKITGCIAPRRVGEKGILSRTCAVHYRKKRLTTA